MKKGFARLLKQYFAKEKPGSQYQGFVWESGPLSGCVFLFPANRNKQEICIGSSALDSPDLLIQKCKDYIYFCVGGSGTGDPHDYDVINDFVGPIKSAHSGDVFQFGEWGLRLL